MTAGTQKNIILFLGKIAEKHILAVRDAEKHLNTNFRIALLTHCKYEINEEFKKDVDFLIRTNIKRLSTVEDTLLPIRDQVVAFISRYENTMPLYSRLIPFFPYIKNPISKSIQVANDKVEMRKILRRYVPKLTPKFMVVTDQKKVTLDKIEETISFPCILKPASLSRSQLVINCYYREELEHCLKDAFKKIKALYKANKVEHEPKLLVEQLIEGDLYSVDVYVNSYGRFYFTPFIRLVTGKDIGRDDFFMYSQIAPTSFDSSEILSIKDAVGKAIRAFGLRSCTAHVEFYKIKKNGVKIVEIGARVGGYRDEILGDAYAIKHSMNDILIHLGKKPIIKTRQKKYTAFLKYWPQKSGILKKLKGFKKISEMDFVVRPKKNMQIGERVGLSKYGYPFICSFYVHADTRSKLLGNIRKVEKTLDIVLQKK